MTTTNKTWKVNQASKRYMVKLKLSQEAMARDASNGKMVGFVIREAFEAGAKWQRSQHSEGRTN